MLNFLIRAFALSLSIVWRALPMWVALFAVFYVLMSMLAGSPFLLILIMLLTFGTTMFFMMFSHIRAGLSALGETTAPDVGKLMRKAMKFCFFVGMINVLVAILNIGGFSDAVFNIIAAFAGGTLHPDHWVGVINGIEL